MTKKNGIVFGLILCVGGVYFLWPEPPPPPKKEFIDDTGLTRFQTEELMREIGYVQ
ncbi:MAG: hypothetical protein ACON4U_09130 [Myxococcota bacterium]